MGTLLLVIDLVLLVALMALIIHETRQIKKNDETINKFIDAHSEIFSVVNTNASVSQEIAERVDVVEKNSEFFKMLLDAHAHVLRIYAPSLNLLEPPASDKIEHL